MMNSSLTIIITGFLIALIDVLATKPQNLIKTFILKWSEMLCWLMVIYIGVLILGTFLHYIVPSIPPLK